MSIRMQESSNTGGENLPKTMDEPQSIPLMGGVARPEGIPEATDLDLDSGAAPTRSVSAGTLIILGVLVVAAGSLYAMRLSQQDIAAGTAAAKDVEAKVEQALAKLTQPQAMAADDPLAKRNLDALFRDTDSIITMFASDMTKRQVPIDYVQKNPFVLPVTREPDPTPVPGAPVQVVERRDDGRLKKIQAEVKELKLQTVMEGRVPVAIINGSFVQVGQKVGSLVLKSLDSKTRSVELEWENQTFKLTMEEKPGDGKGRSGLR